MTGEELQEFAGMIRGCYMGKWWFDGDPDDVAQDAALHTLEAYRKKRVPLKGHRAYYFRPAMCETKLAWNRARATVTMGERAAARSSEYSDRTPLVGCGGRVEDGALELREDGGPDADRRRRDAAAARSWLMSILEDHVESLEPGERPVVAMMLGISGQLRQLDPDEVYAATGMSVSAAWAIVRRFGKLVRNDPGAIRARRAYISLQEAT